MPISIFPTPTISASEDGFSYTLATALKQYKVTQTFLPGIYKISTSPAYEVLVEFFLPDNTIVSTTTSSGTINFNLASTCSDTTITLLSGSDTIVTIDKIASSISGAELSGTLDTITSSGTYNQTGKLYVLCVGGGGGGSGSDNANYLPSGHGGGAGGHGFAYVYTNAPTTVTIGSGGNGVPRSTNVTRHDLSANSGGDTNFGNLVTGAAGNGAGAPRNGNPGYTGNIQTGGNGGANSDSANAISSNRKTIKDGSNGGGGAGKRDGGTIYSAKGSGIGTGGTGGGTPSVDGNSGTGYGAGGGGGGFNGNVGGNGYSGGGDGTSGVIYVLRGF